MIVKSASHDLGGREMRTCVCERYRFRSDYIARTGSGTVVRIALVCLGVGVGLNCAGSTNNTVNEDDCVSFEADAFDFASVIDRQKRNCRTESECYS
jgi:hypothetical protein